MKQLFLRAAQVFVGLASLFVKDGALDGARDLTADGDEQVYVSGREFAGCAATHDKAADDAILGPKDDDVGSHNLFFQLCLAENRRQRETLGRKNSRMHGLDVLQQFGLHGNRRTVPGVIRAMTHSGDAAQMRAILVEKIDRGGIQAEKLGHLAQRAVQRIAEVQRFAQCLADGVQHHEFAVAAADFGLGLLSLGDVQDETLISGHVSCGIPYGHRGLEHGAYFAVLAAHFELEIGNRTVLQQEFLEPFAIGGIGIKGGRNVNGHQVLAGLVAGHSKKRLIEIEEPALRRGNEDAFLHTRNEAAIFFFRPLSIGNVFQYVDCSELAPAWVRKGGVGRQEIAGEPRIEFVALARYSLAVRATLVSSVFDGEELRNAAANQRFKLATQELAEPLIAAENPSQKIVDQDGVSDGVEGILPLVLGVRDLFKQAHILQGQTEKVSDVDEIGDLIGLKPHMAHRADCKNTQRLALARKGQRDKRFQAGFIHSFAGDRIPLFLGLQELAALLQGMLSPGFGRWKSGIPSHKRRLKSHGGPSHELRRMTFTFHQADNAVGGAKTLNEMGQNLVDYLLD